MTAVRLHEAATQEAIEAAAWYEHKRLGLGAKFERAIQAALDLLEQEIVPATAVRGSAGRRGTKRLILKRFPYDVVFQERVGEIVVIAFAHHSRRPGYWRNRLHK
ncbi:MAG: hypothetical protein ACREV9_01520 [Burkholderiales bacterium]